ncbi:MAG: LOG family protein [Alphaproteobacteria bacterium]
MTAADNDVIEKFKEENRKEGIRVFVAGGSRSGNDEIYAQEAYNLGKKIVKMEFKLDFGLSNSGIMGAVARGVLDGWNKRQSKQNKNEEAPIQGITTSKYFALYQTDDSLIQKMDIVVAKSLEERKRMLLKADFVVFAPGGVGTLDELAYDCVAMQDDMLPMKPFIIYNINGFFHHLLEYLKFMAYEGFAEPVPFIVVDDADELEVAFRLLKYRYNKYANGKEAYTSARQLVYELPYFIKMKTNYDMDVDHVMMHITRINEQGADEDKQFLQDEIEMAYLEKEIERMYDRLMHTGQDTGKVSEKLSRLKKRRKDIYK